MAGRGNGVAAIHRRQQCRVETHILLKRPGHLVLLLPLCQSQVYGKGQGLGCRRPISPSVHPCVQRRHLALGPSPDAPGHPL